MKDKALKICRWVFFPHTVYILSFVQMLSLLVCLELEIFRVLYHQCRCISCTESDNEPLVSGDGTLSNWSSQFFSGIQGCFLIKIFNSFFPFYLCDKAIVFWLIHLEYFLKVNIFDTQKLVWKNTKYRWTPRRKKSPSFINKSSEYFLFISIL